MKDQFIILDENGYILSITNQQPKDGILYTTKDYTELKEVISPKFNFKLDIWENEIETLNNK